jgi:outer membrane protein assembly factor BamB
MKQQTLRLMIFLFVMIFISGNLNLYTNNRNPIEQHTLSPANPHFENILGSSATNDWPMLYKEPQRTGFIDSGAPETNTTLWTQMFAARSSPIIAEGKLYLNSNNVALIVYNAYNKNVIKNIPLGLRATIAVDNGKLFATNDNKIICYSTQDYTEQWNVSIDGETSQFSIVPYGSYLYLAFENNTGNTSITARNTVSGDHRWSDINLDVSLTSDIVIDSNNIYVTLDKKLICYNTTTGGKLWENTILTGVDTFDKTIPTIDNGKLYTFSKQGIMYCLDIHNTGSILWQYTTGDQQTTTKNHLTVAYNNIYVGTNKKLLCVNLTTHQQEWNYSYSNNLALNPIVADGKVYVRLAGLRCIDAHTGHLIWQYSTGSSLYCPAIVGNILYYVDQVTIYAFSDTVNGAPTQPSTPETTTIPRTINTMYTFTTTSTDADTADQLEYLFNWGDGTDSGWVGPYNSGVEASVSHSWTSPGTYEVKVKAKDPNVETIWSPSVLITLTETTQPQLTIAVSPSTIIDENEPFSVLVTSNSQPVSKATVLFADQSYTTDNNGHSSLTAPDVDKTTRYSLTVSKEGFASKTSTITVLNTQTGGFIYGIITNAEGALLENVEISAILPAEETTKHAFSDSDGLYVISLPQGPYSITYTKEGYTTQQKTVTVVTQLAVEQNIVLQPTITPQNSGDTSLVSYILDAKITDGTIGAKMQVSPQQTPTISIYQDGVGISDVTTRQQLSFTVSGVEGTSGTVIAIILEKGTLPDFSALRVQVDSILINQETNAKAFFTFETTAQPSWYSIPIDSETTIALIKINHFSTHTIIISSVIDLFTGPIAVLIYLICSIIAGTLFLSRVFTHPVYVNYFKKKNKQ